MRSEFLLDTWYFAATSGEVSAENKAGNLFHRKLLNHDVVIYRDKDGIAHALEDRCPHRFAPLHMGRIVDNKVQCGYHGLTFDHRGQCVLNPHGDGFIPPKARVAGFPLRELHGLIWIWLGEPEKADPGLIPDLSFLLDGRRSKVAGYHIVKSNYEVINDNLADLTHVQFVHAGYQDSDNFEKKTRYLAEQQGRSVKGTYCIENSRVAPMWGRVLGNEQLIVDRWLETTWHAASNFSLFTCVTLPGKSKSEALGSVLSAHLLTPETSRSTHYYYAHCRDYKVGDAAMDEIVREWQRVGFKEQDQPFLEAVEVAMDGRPLNSLQPVLLATDAGAMRIRRVLDSLISAEHQSAPAMAT